MGAVAVQDGGGRVTGGVQSIEGDHRTADVDLLQEGSDGSDLTTLVGEDAAADRLLVVVADQGHGLVLGLALAVGAAQALAIGGQCGGVGGTRRQPAVGGGLKRIRIGVGHGAVEGGAGGWMVASGALVAPSAEGAQLILSKMTGVAPHRRRDNRTAAPTARSPAGPQVGTCDPGCGDDRGYASNSCSKEGNGTSVGVTRCCRGCQVGHGWGARRRARASARRG